VLVNAVRSVRFGVTTIYTQVLYTARRAVLSVRTRGLPDLRLTLQIDLRIQINKTIAISSTSAFRPPRGSAIPRQTPPSPERKPGVIRRADARA